MKGSDIKRRDMQLGYIEEMKERFPDAQLLKVPMFDQEIKGMEMLKKVAALLFEDAVA